MDQRTKQKYLGQARLMLHLFEGHLSRLPKPLDIPSVVVDGMRAAQALGIESMTRELVCEAESAKNDQQYLSDKLKAANGKIEELTAELIEIKKRPAVPLLYECERMGVKTMKPLPCGERLECYGCDKAPEGMEPIPTVWNSQGSVYQMPPRESFGIGCSLPSGDM